MEQINTGHICTTIQNRECESSQTEAILPINDLPKDGLSSLTRQSLCGSNTPNGRPPPQAPSILKTPSLKRTSFISMNNESSPLDSFTKQKKASNTVTKTPLSWWWWWEIAAAILSVFSLIFIFLILFMVNNKPLENWNSKHPIRLNSLISVLMTIGKTTMMVPIASCVSQLKWGHFQTPQSLRDIQIYESASRGPWGSLVMLSHPQSWRNDLLSGTFAGLTILALAIQPMSQQVLFFGIKQMELKNITAELASANQYMSKVAEMGGDTGKIADDNDGPKALIETAFSTFANIGSGNYTTRLKFHVGLMNQMTDSELQPFFKCPKPATICSWEEFTTLALCGESEDVTDQTIRQCNQTNIHRPELPVVCEYKVPHSSDPLSLFFGSLEDRCYDSFRTTLSRPLGDNQRLGSLYTLRPAFNFSSAFLTGSNVTAYPDVKISMSYWFWCTRTYQNVTAQQGKLSRFDLVKTEKLMNSDLHPYHYVANSSNRGYSTNVDGSFFVQHFASILDSVHKIQRGEMVLDTKTGLSRYDEPSEDWYYSGISSKEESIGTAQFMLKTDIAKITENVAMTFTNQMLNMPGMFPDNRNLTTVRGKAFTNAIFVEVRWLWLLLPLMECVATCVLLALTIITNRQPLLKSSSLALLFHGLDGREEKKLEVKKPETEEGLEDLAANMRTIFQEDERGRLKFTQYET